MALEISISLVRSSIKYTELFAAILGTIYYYKYKKTYLKYFLYLLWYITFTEFFGDLMIKNNFLIYIDQNGIKYNIWIVNLLYSVFFPMLFFIYYNSIENKKYKLLIKLFLISFILVSIINWIFFQNFTLEWSELPYIFGSLTMIITIIFYYIELLKSDKIILFHRTLLFWISVGLLIFLAGNIPFIIKINGYALISGVHQIFLIMYILAIIMYLTFAFGFIWSKKE